MFIKRCLKCLLTIILKLKRDNEIGDEGCKGLADGLKTLARLSTLLIDL